MTGTKRDLIRYRIERARDTLDDARILAENQKWNSAINRLYYAAYYGVIALLLQHEHKPTTHNGAKSQFSEHFIKTKIFPEEYGKLYSQLFTWRQKGDYVDLFDFSADIVLPYIEPVENLLNVIENSLNQ